MIIKFLMILGNKNNILFKKIKVWGKFQQVQLSD